MKARLLAGTAIVGVVGLVASMSSMLPASSAPAADRTPAVDCSTAF